MILWRSARRNGNCDAHSAFRGNNQASTVLVSKSETEVSNTNHRISVRASRLAENSADTLLVLSCASCRSGFRKNNKQKYRCPNLNFPYSRSAQSHMQVLTSVCKVLELLDKCIGSHVDFLGCEHSDVSIADPLPGD